MARVLKKSSVQRGLFDYLNTRPISGPATKTVNHLFVVTGDSKRLIPSAVKWYAGQAYVTGEMVGAKDLLQDNREALRDLESAQTAFRPYKDIFICLQAEVDSHDSAVLTCLARSPLSYIGKALVFYSKEDALRRIKGILNRAPYGEAWIEAINLYNSPKQERRWFRAVAAHLEYFRTGKFPFEYSRLCLQKSF